MRRATSSLPSSVSFLVALTVTVALTLSLPGPAAGAGDPSSSDADASADVSGATVEVAARALGRDASGSAADRAEATLALRDLFVARRSLGESDVVEADRLLARPTDGARDPYGDGYSSRGTKSCSTNVCVHYVRSGADAPPGAAWAKKTRRVMEKVWRHHTSTLGFRKPARDGSRGGNAKFDVYLKELGARGLYGYCAPERRVKRGSKRASGFCVLDNDFAASQFGRPPLQSLRVTAAHEFFHAIQFAYDFTEDHWLLESTATWIEERFADDVNDNRSYLKFGQAARAATSLDLFEPSGLAHYGNWVWWEFLSQRLGNSVVRKTIERAGTGSGLPDDYSTQALTKVVRGSGGLPRLYASFASANTLPKRSYEEGAVFPGVAPIAVATLRSTSPRQSASTRIDHLAAKTVKVKPGSLRAKAWRLRVTIDGPRRATSPSVSVLVLRDNGAVLRRTVRLDRLGRGTKVLPFSSRSVRSVSVTLANASTRTRCNAGTAFACAGRPLDQREPFQVSFRALRR